MRELDVHLGFGDLVTQHMADSRCGKNTQFPLADLLTRDENLARLATVNRELIGGAKTIDSSQRVVPDMDSIGIPVYGQEEQSAYNDHFDSTFHHPLSLFHTELGADLSYPGDARSAASRNAGARPAKSGRLRAGRMYALRCRESKRKYRFNEYLNHLTVLDVQTKNGGAEVHEQYDDIFVAAGGEATLVTGCMVRRPKSPGKRKTGSICGGRREAPGSEEERCGLYFSGVTHQLLVASGKHFACFVIKVHEWKRTIKSPALRLRGLCRQEESFGFGTSLRHPGI